MRSFLALTTLLMTAVAASHALTPPDPPPEFADSQSPPKPEPFPIRYVDQGQFNPKLKGLLAPEGFRVDIVADETAVVNPVGMTFTPDGTLVVLEWTVDPITGGKWFEFAETFRYQDGSTRQVATMRKFVTDPVKVLKLDPATGTYPESTPIISEELPSSIIWHDGWLYTSGRGTVRRYKKSRPNGPWDVREVIAQGFCGFHHHQVSGLTIGLDGKLYITSGDDDNFVEGSDGSRATVLRTGAVFRCNPDGSDMETFSLGFRNPYRDLALDDKYRFLHADNDNEDGSKFTGCRLMHVAEESDFGWRLRSGARCCRPDLTRGAVAGELPGKLPPMLRTGRGSPAGLLIYHDTRLPERYRGLMYYPDVFRRLVRAYKATETGSTLAVTHEFEFMKSDDPLFRPCQMVTGPDGAIYVCDWRTDSGGAGRLSGDGAHGRIYRISWVGTADEPAIPLRGVDSWAKILALPDAELVAALDAVDLTDRQEARKEIVRRMVQPGSAVLSLVRAKFQADGFTLAGRLEALGTMHAAQPSVATEFFRVALADPDAAVRRLAAEGLGLRAPPGDAVAHSALFQVLTDRDPGVRRAAVLACGRVAAPGAADSILNAWRADAGADAFLADAYLRALERVGKPGLDALIRLAESGDEAELNRVVTAFTALRSRAAATALPDLLANPHLNSKARVALLQSYTNYLLDPALPVEPILATLAAAPNAPPDVVVAALAVVSSVGTNPPTAVAGYIQANLNSTHAEIRLAAIQAAEDTRLAPALPRLLTLLKTPIDATDEALAVVRAVRAINNRLATRPLTDYLAVAPVNIKDEVIRAIAALDPDEAQRVVEPYLDHPAPKVVETVVGVLGGSKSGAKLVAKRYLDQKLSRTLFPRISEIVARYPTDPDLMRLASELQKGNLLVGTDPARLAEVVELVAARGDAVRGKAIFLDPARVSCISCHKLEGVGGQVGPDLTRVWDTHTTEKMLETILMPSKEIKEGYQSYKAATLSGQVYVGLKVTDTATEVVIREATGRDVTIPKDDLDELTAQSISLMPENSVAQLSFEEFLDLLAFLKNQAAQESLRRVVTAPPPAVNGRQE